MTIEKISGITPSFNAAKKVASPDSVFFASPKQTKKSESQNKQILPPSAIAD